MSKLRPELGPSTADGKALSDETALFLIKESVERRHMLIHGRLKDGRGNYCAIGSFWADNPGTTLHTALIDEVATVNDSVPASATAKERWTVVRRWLRWKIKVMANSK